jgi:hypothetical protein
MIHSRFILTDRFHEIATCQFSFLQSGGGITNISVETIFFLFAPERLHGIDMQGASRREECRERGYTA